MVKIFAKYGVLLSLLPILLGAFILSMLRYVWAVFTNTDEAWRIAIAIDDLGNVTFNGSLGQTISSRCAHSSSRLCRALCWILDQVDPGHCQRALTAPDQNLQLQQNGSNHG